MCNHFGPYRMLKLSSGYRHSPSMHSPRQAPSTYSLCLGNSAPPPCALKVILFLPNNEGGESKEPTFKLWMVVWVTLPSSRLLSQEFRELWGMWDKLGASRGAPGNPGLLIRGRHLSRSWRVSVLSWVLVACHFDRS